MSGCLRLLKMNGDVDYALEKINSAIHVLTTHSEGIKVRLLEAYELYLIDVQLEDIPPELTTKWEGIVNRMSKFGPAISVRGEVWRDAVQNTIPRIWKKTAAMIAQDLEAFCIHLKGSIERNKAEPDGSINSVRSAHSVDTP